MDIYTRHDRDFDLSLDESAILGFQQVKSNENKVFIWFKQVVERPNYLDKHKTTRMMNDSQRRHDWAKSVWSIDKVMLHLKPYLSERSITKEMLLQLSDDKISNKWETADGTVRNFVKCIIKNPIDFISGKPLNVQITHQAGKAFDSVYSRAYEEYLAGEGSLEELTEKYKERSVIKTYASKLVGSRITKVLKEVYCEFDGKKVRVYEDKEIVIGEPCHTFVEYSVISDIPIDEYNDSNEIEIEVRQSSLVKEKAIELV